MSLITELNTFPLACIYVFVDHKSKLFAMGFTKESGIISIAKELTALRRGFYIPALQEAYNRGELEIELVREYADNQMSQIIRADYNTCVNEYKLRGYTDLRNYKSANYKLITRIMTDYRDLKCKKPLVYVLSQTRINGEMILAIFDSVPEADDWIKVNYGSDRIGITPKFHDNELTKGFHSAHGYKIENVKRGKQVKFKKVKGDAL